MADTLYLKDGSMIPVIGDEQQVLGDIIKEELGTDCYQLYDRLTLDPWIDSPDDWVRREDVDDYESECDGYRDLYTDASERLNNLHDYVVNSNRISKNKLLEEIEKIRTLLSNGI